MAREAPGSTQLDPRALPEHRDDPVLIGALGGSGTRAFSKVLRRGGIEMGAADDHEDALAFSRYYGRFLAEYLQHGSRFAPERTKKAGRHFNTALRRHLDGVEDRSARWGAKNPRSILMLAFWHQHYPRLSFIHVVRNGLDMAFSSNQIQPDRFGEFLVEEFDEPDAVRAIRYWSVVNTRAADYGETNLGRRYLRVRHEDLCLHPRQTVARLFDFLDVTDPERLDAAVAEVSRPADIGRWRDRPPAEVAQLAELGGSALRRFGYWDTDVQALLAR